MPLQVINVKNQIICSACPKPQPLIVTSQTTVFADKQLCATVDDFIPMENIMPFGPCALTPLPPSPSGGPCVPKTTSPWQPGSPTVKHEKQRALRECDTLQCATGGTISVLFAGQIPYDVDA